MGVEVLIALAPWSCGQGAASPTRGLAHSKNKEPDRESGDEGTTTPTERRMRWEMRLGGQFVALYRGEPLWESKVLGTELDMGKANGT